MLASLERRKSGCLLVTDLTNIRYLTGFTGSAAIVLITPSSKWFVTDSRYKLQAAVEVKGYRKRISRSGSLGEALDIVRRIKPSVLAFEGGSVSYEQYLAIRRALRGSGVRVRSVTALIEAEREVKDFSELKALRAAVNVAASGYASLKRATVLGQSERELAATVEAAVMRNGADALAFDMVVASGERAALPHARATDKKIRKGDLLIVDMGVTVEGYCSDQTRTYVIGRPTRRQSEIYRIVKDAHDLAVESVRAGVKAATVDRAAREYIKKAGFGKCFSHGTGHGLGLKVHEAPNVGPKSAAILKEGSVITIEPGIYIAGWGGVRIEDMVVVTEAGAEMLTNSPDELTAL